MSSFSFFYPRFLLFLLYFRFPHPHHAGVSVFFVRFSYSPQDLGGGGLVGEEGWEGGGRSGEERG